MDINELQRRNEELSIINVIAEHLNRETSLDVALNTTLQQVVQLFHLKTGWIWLLDQDQKSTYLAASYHLPKAFLADPHLLEGNCWCIGKYINGNLEDASNISEGTCTRLENLLSGTDGLKYHASVPLFSRDTKIGIMNVVSSDLQELADQDLQLLYTIGDLLSIAVERARLFEGRKTLGILEERNRLAREIHDTLSQGLSGISLRLQTIQLLLDDTTQKGKIKLLLQQTLDLTQTNLEDARRSVLDLRATPLLNHTLPEALQNLLNHAKEQSNFKTIFKQEGTFIALPIRIELGIYRIVQEALSNIQKHAQANLIKVLINFQKDFIHLAIQDNGIGFDPESTIESGFGLISMNERANLLKGTLEIQSSSGAGTLVKIKIPIKIES